VDSWHSVDTDDHTDWLATAARTAHVAVGITRLDGGAFVEVNQAFCRLFNLTREQLVGHTATELGLWPDTRQRQRLMEVLQRQGTTSRFEVRYRNSLGEIGRLEVSARIALQGPAPYLIEFLTEVTDRHELVEGLRVAQSRLGVILRSSKLLAFRQDRALRYTWVANPALGATESDLLGRTDEDILGAKAAEPLVAIKRRVLESGQPERRDVWVANRGHLGCFDLVVEPEHDAAGRVVGILCAAHDITQRMCAQDLGLGAPLVAIQGMSALIGREALTPRQLARLQRINREVECLVGPGQPDLALEHLRQRHAGALVVVAEHNPVLRELVAALLEQAGLRVAAASSGVEAFSFTLQLAPALLLLDMEFPQSGGVAAARALRAMVPQDLPIVAMLSAAPPGGATRALDADLDDVLDKPVTATLLYQKVLSCLNAHP